MAARGVLVSLPRGAYPSHAPVLDESEDWHTALAQIARAAIKRQVARNAARRSAPAPASPTTPAQRLAAIRATRAAKKAASVAKRAEAARRKVEAAVLPHYCAGGYRQASSAWAPVSHRVEVRIGAPDATGDTDGRAWSRNGKWSGDNSRRTLTVPAGWPKRVLARGLATCRDGAERRLVLDCDEVRGALAHVCVVLPSRGFALRTEWRWVEAAHAIEVAL